MVPGKKNGNSPARAGWMLCTGVRTTIERCAMISAWEQRFARTTFTNLVYLSVETDGPYKPKPQVSIASTQNTLMSKASGVGAPELLSVDTKFADRQSNSRVLTGNPLTDRQKRFQAVNTKPAIQTPNTKSADAQHFQAVNTKSADSRRLREFELSASVTKVSTPNPATGTVTPDSTQNPLTRTAIPGRQQQIRWQQKVSRVWTPELPSVNTKSADRDRNS